MDPTLFGINWDVVAEVLVVVIVLAFFVERALSLLFEHRVYVAKLREKGLKEPIAFALSLAVVVSWKFDALSAILSGDENTPLGYAITAALIAGGSKASIALFQGVFQAKSSAEKAASIKP